MALSERAKRNIERQTQRLCGSAGQSELGLSEAEKIPSQKTKSRAELNIERQTARLKGGR